jgi:proteic killer suppression protein
MIRSYKHKGLGKFFHNNDRSGINPKHASKLGRILDRLDASVRPGDMNLPGYKLHELSGEEKGTWSVWVTGNWRVTFQFDGADAIVVDYRDYH